LGAIHKRLWDAGRNAADLGVAYARGYFIKNDHYNGINFAFLLNVRAAESKGDEAIAEVLALCESAIAVERSRSTISSG
jgi:hypothetical protein